MHDMEAICFVYLALMILKEGYIYFFWLAARDLLYASSHSQDIIIYHGLCYTSCGALAGKRNSPVGPAWRGTRCSSVVRVFANYSISDKESFQWTFTHHISQHLICNLWDTGWDRNKHNRLINHHRWWILDRPNIK